MVKKNNSKENDDKSDIHCAFHEFQPDILPNLRKDLLKWYDENQRVLPWRTAAKEEKNPNKRGYAIWVSEIMLQQTQVATVIKYYENWMKKWPTMEDLAQATLDEVNQAWAGLGYYSRGRRLWEGAKKVVSEHNGELPRNSEALEKLLPGVGKYTANAIASIAFEQKVGIVDGNVIRVISRLRAIGADISQNETMNMIWKNANSLVDPDRPGDFNQSLMELGASICSPRTAPTCKLCPVRNYCLVKNDGDIEDSMMIENCNLCLEKNIERNTTDPILDYPQKRKKTKVTEKANLVFIIRDEDYFPLVRRPETGLLANLYEFPSIELEDAGKVPDLDFVKSVLKQEFNLDDFKFLKSHGQVDHKFSHISQKYFVWSLNAKIDQSFKPKNKANVEHVKQQDEVLDEKYPMSTAMKKCWTHYRRGGKSNNNKREREIENQPSIAQFFAKKCKKEKNE